MTDIFGNPLQDGDRIAATPHLLTGDILVGALEVTAGQPFFIPNDPSSPCLKYNTHPERVALLHTHRQVIRL